MGAIEEVEKEPDGNLRFLMTGAFHYVLAEQSPLMAREWMDRRSKAYGFGPSGFPNTSIIHGATQRGAAELIALYELDGKKWKEQKEGFPSADLPADFDFGLLVKHFPTNDNYGMKRAMTSWGVKDKEGAMAAMRGNLSEQGGKATAKLAGVGTGVGGGVRPFPAPAADLPAAPACSRPPPAAARRRSPASGRSRASAGTAAGRPSRRPRPPRRAAGCGRGG